MNISLPEALKTYLDSQVSEFGYGSTSEYVRALIRRDRERTQLRELLRAGAASAPGTPADAGYFGKLRQGIRNRATK